MFKNTLLYFGVTFIGKINRHSERVIFAPTNATSWSEMIGLAKNPQEGLLKI